MALVSLFALSDGVTPVAVEATQVSALEPIGSTGSRLSIARGASDLTAPSFVEVVGVPLAVGTTLGSAGALFAPFTPLGTSAVCAISPVHVAAIEPIPSGGVRVSIPRPPSENGPPPFIDVAGTVASVIALFKAAGFPSFLSLYLFRQASWAPFLTNSAALVLVPGSAIAIPADGNYLITVNAFLETSNIANGFKATLRKNGNPIGQQAGLQPGQIAVGDSVPIVSTVFDSASQGDVFDLAVSADPGGAGDQTAVNGILYLWQTST